MSAPPPSAKPRKADLKAAAAAAASSADSADADGKGKKKKAQAKFTDSAAAPFVNTTPAGALKDFGAPMADAYHPPAVEAAWDAWWEKQGLFQPEMDSDREKFVLVIPPPNVTGTLHLGHALTIAVEDAVVRWNRMSGKNTLWVPGTDHAGIATQVVVEKKLQRETGKSRHDIGREAFIEEVWKWKEQSGNRIKDQLRRLGASVDWSREVFTMDAERCAAVEEAFLRMHERKLISRANRLVNWSCALRSAISNVEVDYVDLDKPTMLKVPGYAEPVEFGVIHSFVYKLADGSGELVVATTRIETMLGDTAVAVHPDDERYKQFHGKALKHPFISDRKINVICDPELVDMSFGTGAVKVTPAHDPNDYKCGTKHGLEFVNIFDNDGLINEHGGRFAGMKRFDVRSAIITELDKLGLYRGKASNPMSLGICSRSKDVIEPVVRPQWFVDCKGMAQRAVEAVKSGQLQIIPQAQESTWFNWLENIQDWCVSRQLWWGHRIPAYIVRFEGEEDLKEESLDDDAHWFTGRSEEEAKAKAETASGKKVIGIRRDEDVLDTWFSSGLFPFSVMGWPKQTKDLEQFFPGSLLETGNDILFFWVARMVMMSLELTGQLPFKQIYLHAMVRDKFGRKMSKSLGNVVDPLDVMDGITLEQLNEGLRQGNLDPLEVQRAIEGQKRDFPEGIAQCGADALRFGLLAYTSQGRDINLDIQRVVAYRMFGNKLWQATRFALLNFDASFVKPAGLDAVAAQMQASPALADRWILHRLHRAVVAADQAFRNYEFSAATTAIYNFWLYELCDVYLEVIKPILRLSETPSESDIAARNTALSVLYTCLDAGLRLLHPLMPFITEELYHRLPGANLSGDGGREKCGSISVAPYPAPASTQRFEDAKLDQTMQLLQDVAHTARSTRATLGLTKQRLTMYIRCANDELYEIVKNNAKDISVMSVAAGTIALKSDESPPAGCLSSVVSPLLEIHCPLAGMVDVGAEIVKMDKQALALQAKIQKMKALMAGAGYAKVPEATKEKNSAQLANDTMELEKLEASINNFKSVLTPDQLAKYVADKLASFAADKAKLEKNIAKLRASLPEDVEKQPKKTLQKIAEAEQDVREIEEQMAKLSH